MFNNKLFAILIAIVATIVFVNPSYAGTTGPGDAVLVGVAQGDDCYKTSGMSCEEIAARITNPTTGGSYEGPVMGDNERGSFDMEHMTDEDVTKFIPPFIVLIIIGSALIYRASRTRRS
jgi:hypothetical protein